MTPLVLSFSKISLSITAFPLVTISFLLLKFLLSIFNLFLEKTIPLFLISLIFIFKILFDWILLLFIRVPSFFKFLFLIVTSLTANTSPLFVIVSPTNIIFDAWISELLFNTPLFTIILFVAINLSVFSSLSVSIFTFFPISSLLFLISFEFINISSLDWIFPSFIIFLFWLILILPIDRIFPLFNKSTAFKSISSDEYIIPLFTKVFVIIFCLFAVNIFVLLSSLSATISNFFAVSSLFSILLAINLISLSE